MRYCGFSGSRAPAHRGGVIQIAMRGWQGDVSITRHEIGAVAGEGDRQSGDQRQLASTAAMLVVRHGVNDLPSSLQSDSSPSSSSSPQPRLSETLLSGTPISAPGSASVASA